MSLKYIRFRNSMVEEEMTQWIKKVCYVIFRYKKKLRAANAIAAGEWFYKCIILLF